MRIPRFATTFIFAVTTLGLAPGALADLWDGSDLSDVTFPVPTDTREARHLRTPSKTPEKRDLMSTVVVGTPSATCVSPVYPTIMAALASEPSGVTLDLCSETFVEEVVIAPSYSVEIKGQGIGNTIIQPPSVASTAVNAGAGSVKISLQDLTLDGNDHLSSGAGAVAGFVCENSCVAELKRVEVKNILEPGLAVGSFDIFASSGTSPANAVKIYVEECVFPNVGVVGIFVNGPGSVGVVRRNRLAGRRPVVSQRTIGIQVGRQATGEVSQNILRDFDATPLESTAINSFCPASGTKIFRNDIGDSDLAVVLLNSVLVGVYGNEIFDSKVGISLEFNSGAPPADCGGSLSVERNHIQENKIKDSITSGVRLVSNEPPANTILTNNAVLKNKVGRSGEDGIWVDAGSENVFAGNVLAENVNSGIRVTNGKDDFFKSNVVTE